MSDQPKRALPPVVRELAALVAQYRRRRIDAGAVLGWLDDGWTREKLLAADDGPSHWLAPKVRATLLEADAGLVSDEKARAAIVALIREYQLRRSNADWRT